MMLTSLLIDHVTNCRQSTAQRARAKSTRNLAYRPTRAVLYAGRLKAQKLY
jgi:hypothetical protein